MNTARFRSTVREIRKKDPRFTLEGYLFLSRALEYSTDKVRRANPPSVFSPHVSGQDLLNDFCELALRDMGPMAITVLREWGITEGYHVGEMVFHLIYSGIFTKTPSDRLSDFENAPTFYEIFEKPFLPLSKQAEAEQLLASKPLTEC